ncbi:MAG: peptide chain release factor 2 [Clostridia bacterium]|nr:peptide chain release factor 2 [Clostridia bacterium]
MDLDLLKENYKSLKVQFEKLYNACRIEELKEQLDKLEKETAKPGFYENSQSMASILSNIKLLSSKVKKFDDILAKLDDIAVYIELLNSDEDYVAYKEAEKEIQQLNEKIGKLEIESLLSSEYDANNAIVSIHPGAGGTESQDWAEMLQKMYQKWAQKNDYDVEILDYQVGEEAGIKSVSFLVRGLNAYGYLKSESGVHRLVRISPFDSNSRRHTSFAAVEVMPEISDDINLNIRSEDLEIDTFRASGAGGQHINKTESAIRIKHIPTGIVVGCQTERSQIQNREYAMKMLRAKLFDYERKKQEEEKARIKGESLDIAWGSQIRSYVFCPYTLVKDHRTGFEVGNIEAVMDGKIDDFMYEYLRYISK